MRASVKAMEETLTKMKSHGNAACVDPEIAPVGHIFDLVQTGRVIELEDEGRSAV